jgi:hypothetical protein
MSDKTKRTYVKFHGREPASEFDIELDEMSHLTMLGKIHAIEYKAKKHNDREQQTYRHVFKKSPLLLWNGKELIIYGEIKVTERGII